MFITILLAAIIVLLLVIIFVSRGIMQHRLDTEFYSKNQLVSKVNSLRSEVAALRSEKINDDKQQHHYGIRKAKQELNAILEKFKEVGKINFFQIISTGNLAVKHPLFEQLRSFDYIVITDKGLLNIDVKNWQEKTFYHFSAEPENDIEVKNESLDQIVGRYIVNQYQSQFQSSRKDIYTFTEKIKNNRVEFDFYDHDPYLSAAVNSKELKDAYEKQFNKKITSVGVVYFSDGSINIIDGPAEREKYVATASSKRSLKDAVEEMIVQSKHDISEKDSEVIINYLDQ